MEDFEWNVVNEGQLLEVMIGHKPVGINKHFQMAFICDKFFDQFSKEVTSDKIWKHLETMYNLEVLDEGEAMPFPNSEKEFLLPENEFGSFLVKKEEEEKEKEKEKEKKPTSTPKGRETPKLVKEIKIKEEKTPSRGAKEAPRRDSKDSKEKTPANAKKETKKEPEKSKGKGKNTNSTPREEKKSKNEDTPKPAKRPLRNSLTKPDDSSSSGKSSPVAVAPAKRRRI